VPGVVTVTQPYALADFAESPSYVVSGTVTGLVGFGMRVELVGPDRSVSIPVSPPSTRFAFPFMALFSGNPYEVRVVRQPTNPVQVCSVENATGVIGTSDVSDVVVRCV
jgi:trimeric autotransporter adhesin